MRRIERWYCHNENKSEKLNRWVEHQSELYTGQRQVKANTIVSLHNAPSMDDLDSAPDFEEMTTAIKPMPHERLTLKMLAELLKAGIDPVAERLHHLVSLCWSVSRASQGCWNAKMTTLYKQNEDRGDVAEVSLSLLRAIVKSVARLVLARLQVPAEKIYPESQCGFRNKSLE